MRPVYIATAYLGPIQQYCKMLQYPEVRIETAENYVKQTYRNRCVIAAANGPLSLSIPIVKPDTLKCQTKDIRISDHGNWRHLHWNALVSAYNMSPFFEYYADDFAPFYEKKYEFLLDFNEELRRLVKQADHTAIHATADMYNVTPEQLAEIMKSIFGEKPLPELPKDLTVASGEPDIPHGEEDES